MATPIGIIAQRAEVAHHITPSAASRAHDVGVDRRPPAERTALLDSAVRTISSARRRVPGELRTVTAQLSLSAGALARLLSVSGAQKEFVLSSTDGATVVQVELNVLTVPEGQLALRNPEVVVDWTLGTIANGKQRTSLSRMEMRFLAALLETAPDPVPRGRLAERLWPRDPSRADKERTLAVWIHQLRRRLASIGLAHSIRTIRGVGYCLDL